MKGKAAGWAIALLAFALLAESAHAQDNIPIPMPRPDKPEEVEGFRPPYVVAGFRSARFGTDEKAIRAAIRQDFPKAARAIQQLKNPSDKTTALVIKVAELEPGPGPAAITYIFGGRPSRLLHVNVVWLLTGNPDAAARRGIAVAAGQLAAYFLDFAWPANSVLSGVPVAGNSVVVFHGTDSAGGSIEVRADGVAVTVGKGNRGKEPKGPARLRVAYSDRLASEVVADRLKR